MRLLLTTLALAAATQAQLVTFTAGSPAKASEVNGNFAYLAARLDSLTKALAGKDSAAQRSQSRQDSLAKALAAKDADIASLKASSNWSDSLKELRKRMDAGIPKGTIAGFLTAPQSTGFLLVNDSTWMFAAGQKGVNGIDLPDLRGQFLRGIDYVMSGNPALGIDPDGTRAPGSQQADAFQGHWHRQITVKGETKGFSDANTPQSGWNGDLWQAVSKDFTVGVAEPISDNVNGTPRIAKETRPKNVAVYWYIKVK